MTFGIFLQIYDLRYLLTQLWRKMVSNRHDKYHRVFKKYYAVGKADESLIAGIM